MDVRLFFWLSIWLVGGYISFVDRLLMSLYFDKPRLTGINASRGQAALICKDPNAAAGEIKLILTARRGRSKQKNKTENIYLNEPSCRLVENGRAPLRYARTEIPIFFSIFPFVCLFVFSILFFF